MKKIFISLSVISLLTSCGPQEVTSLSVLKSTKDSLKTEYDRIKEEIISIDEQIALLDTINSKLKAVSVNQTKLGLFEHFFTVHGNVDAQENILVYPDAPAKVKSIKVQEGSMVKKGEIIAYLDASTLEAGLSELVTAIELASEVYERQKKLWDKNIGSEIQYLEAKTNKESLEKKLNTLEEQLEMYQIIAPIDGYLDELFVKSGEMAAPQMPFMRIVNTNQIEITSDISETYITKVHKGDQVNVHVPGSDVNFSASISTVGSFINPNNRTFKITIKPNNNFGLKPNQLAKVDIRDFYSDSAVIIPSRIIQENRNGDQFVFVLQNGKVVKKDINAQWSYNGFSMVETGLNASEIYIDKGCRSVREGEQVEVVKM